MDEGYPAFENAVSQFYEFLNAQSWPPRVFWLRPTLRATIRRCDFTVFIRTSHPGVTRTDIHNYGATSGSSIRGRPANRALEPSRSLSVLTCRRSVRFSAER